MLCERQRDSVLTNFKSSTSLAESDRKRRKASNTFGNPLAFPSKLLAVSVDRYLDPSGNTVLLAGADGSVSVFSLTTNDVARIGRNAQAPVTCVLSFAGQQSVDSETISRCIFAGGWDKSITKFEIPTEVSSDVSKVAQTAFKAHADFVKCLLIAKTPDKRIVLLSGGADGDLNIWSFDGQKLACLRPQSRGIEYIALDPLSNSDAPRVFFATSQREIYSFLLPTSTVSWGSIQVSDPIVQHETSVYKLEFDNDGDLWTASADKTAKRLVRENNFVADTTLAHPDFVRDIVLYEPSSLAITACRDEDIRVWNTGTSQLQHVFSGHFEEVTGLALAGNNLLSISIDATLRRWSLKPQDLKEAIDKAKNPKLLEDEPEPKSNLGGLTEEEEAQLRALMEEEEADTLERMAVDEQ